MTSRYYTLEELEKLHQQYVSHGLLELTPAIIDNLFNQAILDQTTLREFIQVSEVIIHKDVTWSAQLQTIITRYLFGTTDSNVISAAKNLLKKHRGVSVDNLLRRLESFETNATEQS